MQALRALSALLILTCSLAVAQTAAAQHATATKAWTVRSQVAVLREGIAWQRSQAWKWQDAVGRHRSPTAHHERRETSVPYLHWIVSLWNDRRDRAFRAYKTLLRTRPAHYAGWNCIHNGAYPGAPHEGNGTSPNGLYSGPLQMSSPWMGYSYDWNALPTMQVFAIAERVAARNGFAYPFMKGQWPRTFPPCASFF